MSRSRSWRREVEAMAAAYGATVELTGGGHLAIVLPSGAKVYCSQSPSDDVCQVRRNVARDLRRVAAQPRRK